MPHEIEELHRQASAFCIKSDFEAALGLWRRILELRPDDERAIEGVRMCERLLGGGSLTAQPPDPAEELGPAPATGPGVIDDLDAAIDSALLQSGLAPSDPAESAPGPSPAPDLPDAGLELRRRTETLIREASEHLELGGLDEAEQVLARVLILEDDNQEALRLQQEIQDSRQAAEEEVAPPAEAASAGEVPFDPSEILDPEEQQEILPLGVLSPAAPSAEAPAVEDRPPEPDPVGDSLAEVAEVAEVAEESAGRPPRSRGGVPGWLSDRRVLFGAGGVAVLAAAALTLGWFGDDEDSPLLVPLQRKIAEKPAAAARGEQPQSAEEPPTPAVQRDPGQFLEEARASVEAEDWAAAVIAYNELLRQQPDQAEALENLPHAMERYRQQQELQQKWNVAVAYFEAGDYREALRIFYRLQGDMGEARLSRYKVNGWYNLGVTALQGNRCQTALGHFDEALAIRPRDPGVVAAIALADDCLDAGSVGSEARSLGFRALEG